MFKGPGLPFPVIRSDSNFAQILFQLFGTILEDVPNKIKKSKIRASLVDTTGLSWQPTNLWYTNFRMQFFSIFAILSFSPFNSLNFLLTATVH